MKIKLPKAVVITLLQCASADASFGLGGLLSVSKKNNNKNGNDCGSGFDDGRDAMRDRWEDMGESCDNAWDLDDDANDAKDSFPNDGIGT